jgi:hypothetical protein
MMEVGLALFVTRVDGEDIPEKERDQIVKLVAKHAKALKIKSNDGGASRPRVYDYGNYEPRGLGVLLHSDSVISMMDGAVRDDHEEMGKANALKVAKAITKEKPRVYKYKAYYVEV